jgi:UDP-N-acetylglucosamine 2-epimerase (non-hydrolysing)/GDP/UDP-N,N'-diacetylbacillosamine 2-epimerase (hydrolysing)
MPPEEIQHRRVCFVSGTRAEFGLMQSTLAALRRTPNVTLQIMLTGMHLDRQRGGDIPRLRREGWKIDSITPWQSGKNDPVSTAAKTGQAVADMTTAFAKLRTDIVLIVGDRVEAMAAAMAAHISGLIVAHVHGGDRALGQVDDSLRHAITKLAHIHFPATANSAKRIRKLGEDAWRIHQSGSPGIDGIQSAATPSGQLKPPEPFALLLLHPTDPLDSIEHRRAKMLLKSIIDAGVPKTVIIGPNNDPGSAGILDAWRQKMPAGVSFYPDMPRPDFLGLLRNAAFLIGNSSSGIIEAASFGTPVIDVGDRQKGRDRSQNVRNVPFAEAALRQAIRAVWRGGHPKRFACRNIYGGGNAGIRIAKTLAAIDLSNPRLRRKLICY